MQEVSGWKVFGIIVLVVVGLTSCGIAGMAVNWFGWFAAESGKVVKQEFSPQELLRKYDWLKSAHASLESKLADIKANKGKIEDMERAYKGVARNEWAPHDSVQYSQWQTELDGMKISYNNLAAEYNTRMAEIHWRFTNVGGLPQGASETLPREYAPYIEK